MRLLDTNTGLFVEKDPTVTAYAILSHTWDAGGEQTYQELRRIQERYGVNDKSQPNSTLTGCCPGPVLPSLELYPASSSSSSPPEPPLQPTRLSSPSLLDSILPSTVPPDLPSQHAITSSRSIWDDPELSPKIREACAVARRNNFQYIWIDSCCIDKSSSSELSEAINSMYSWYARANVCYAYLADVPTAREDHRRKDAVFRKSRWFKRGWTLQELIAPQNVVFFSTSWTVIGTKWAFADLVQQITGISEEALLQLESLDRFSVAQRLSWALGRETTRVEDQAYSLMGLFDINMPTLYGEGSRAFRRLQEEILRRIPDQSLFAWGKIYLGPQILQVTTPNGIPALGGALDDTTAGPVPIQRSFSFRSLKSLVPSSPLAPAPSSFANCENVIAASLDTTSHNIISSVQLEYTHSPYGIRTQFQMIPLSIFLSSNLTKAEYGSQEQGLQCEWYLAILGCEHVEMPGHLLGRVCCILPHHSGINLLSSARASMLCEDTYGIDLIPLSPEVIKRCKPHIQTKTVYISHPNRDHPDMGLEVANRHKPHEKINLLLLKSTRNALRAQGYASIELRPPDHDRRRASHWLTLANAEHVITVEFRHALHRCDDSQEFLVTALVDVSLPHHDATSRPSRFNAHKANSTQVVSWFGCMPWQTFSKETVAFDRISTGGADLAVDLVLVFTATDVYTINVEVHRRWYPFPKWSYPPLGFGR